MNNINIFNKVTIDVFHQFLKKNYKENNIYNLTKNINDNNLLKNKDYIYTKKYVKSAVLCMLEPNYFTKTYDIILTLRSKKLKHHAGQISFPGGKLETSDIDYKACAYRETKEEIGVNLSSCTYLGMLNKYLTGTGYLVQPILVLSTEKLNFLKNSNEVERILRFPLDYLLSGNNIKKIYYKKNRKELFYYSISWREFMIWGATAKILIDLLSIFKCSHK